MEEFWEIESNTIGKEILTPFEESFAVAALMVYTKNLAPAM